MIEFDHHSTGTPEELAARLDELVRAFEAHPDEAVRRDVMTLLHRVDALHRAGLTRLIEALRTAGAGDAMAQALEDATVRLLLELYDLLPGDDPAPIELALDQVRPFLATHSAHVEQLGVADGVLRVRMTEATLHDSATREALRAAIVSTVREHFPALQRVRFEGDASDLPPNFIPLTLIGAPAPAARSMWQDAAAFADVPTGAMKGVTVADQRLLLCNAGDAVYAVSEMCPGSMLPLAPGWLEGVEVGCLWHGCRFDVRTGQRTAGTGGDLETAPVEIEGDRIRVLIPATSAPATRLR